MVERNQEKEALGAGELADRKILVVEDEEVVRRLVVRLLRAAGFGVIEAESEDDALAIAQGGQAFDLLLTDVVMPKIDGRLLYERMAKHRTDLPVLYMSGYTDKEELLRGENFLQKPFSPDELVNKVRQMLTGSLK